MERYSEATHGTPLECRGKHLLAGIILVVFGSVIFLTVPLILLGVNGFDFGAVFGFQHGFPGVLIPIIFTLPIMLWLNIWGVRIIIRGVQFNIFMRNIDGAFVTNATVTSAQIVTGNQQQRLHVFYNFTDDRGRQRKGKGIFFIARLNDGAVVWARADLSGAPRAREGDRVEWLPNHASKWNELRVTNAEVLFNDRNSIILTLGRLSDHFDQLMN